MGILRTLLAFLFAVTGVVVVVAAFLVAFVGFFLGGIIIVFAFLIAVIGFLLIVMALALVFFAPYFQMILAACIVTTVILIKRKLKKKKKVLVDRDGIEVYVEDLSATYNEDEQEEATEQEVENAYTEPDEEVQPEYSADQGATVFDGPYYVSGEDIDEDSEEIE